MKPGVGTSGQHSEIALKVHFNSALLDVINEVSEWGVGRE